MKLLELAVENVRGVPDGVHSFAEANGSHRDVVVLAGEAAGALLQTIAALVEALRTPVPTAYQLDWWARRRGPGEARLRACWALSEGEAACAGASSRTFTSEWRLGPHDELPRELPAEGARPPRVRVDVTRYAYLDANRSAVWMGGPATDPLAEALASIVREDIAGTRVCCREGVGIVRWSTPDTIAALNPAIARVFPALRLARTACARGEAPVACFRGVERVELDQLADAERTRSTSSPRYASGRCATV